MDSLLAECSLKLHLSQKIFYSKFSWSLKDD